MARFNLLIINGDATTGHQLIKLLYRVFKRNFVFEVDSVDEALKLLQKIRIDLIVADLDKEKGDLNLLHEHFPNIEVVGLYSNLDAPATFNALRMRAFRKSDLQEQLLPELKAMKKGRSERSFSFPRIRYGSASFRDYFTLARAEGAS